MQQLKDQLYQIEEELDSFNKKYTRYNQLEKRIDNMYVLSGFVSLSLMICLFLFIVKLDILSGGAIMLTFYGFIFFTIFLYPYIARLLEFVVRKYYRINRNRSEEFKTKLNDLHDKRYQIKRELEAEVKREQKRIQYIKEDRLIADLEKLTNLTTVNTTYPADLAERIKGLEKEYQDIRRGGLQIRTHVFYENRFAKIQDSLSNGIFSDTLDNPKEESLIPIKTNVISPKTFNPPDSSTNRSSKNEEAAASIEKVNEKKLLEDSKNPAIQNEDKLTGIGLKSEDTISSNRETNQKSIHVEDDKSLLELFGEPKGKNIKHQIDQGLSKNIVQKTDFSKLNEYRKDIGELGELFVLEREQEELIRLGKIKLSTDIIHISINSDSAGYDIASFTENGERKYIEVKTTTGNEFEPFYMSNNEMEAMSRLKNYWIYRVYNFDIHLRRGNIYKIDCSNDLESYYNVLPSSFKISPKK